MSSHREAPEISKDPVADSSDLYAFVSPDNPGTVTLIANYVPLQGPASGPNFYEFGDDVLYEIHIDNNGDGRSVFAGQRAEGFYVDLGSIFDLGDLRPFANLHNTFNIPGLTLNAEPGVNNTDNVNVHSIAIQVPTSELTHDGWTGTTVDNPCAVIGVWTTASRRKVRILGGAPGEEVESGPYVQVSRLGNPLFNEVLVPMVEKDAWNGRSPAGDSAYAARVEHPELAALLPTLYPNVFPNLATFNASGTARADLAAILLTGIPSGIIPGFQNNTGTLQADMLRLNTAIAPSATPNILGLLAPTPDLAGFPNGRRPSDDVVTIELRAIAGVTLPLVDHGFTPDGAAAVVTDGLLPASVGNGYLGTFPYLGVPYSGFNAP